ncbi:hypothetical protein RpY1_038 [Ralstonia phage RpY1]|nr:hypothetical protein RpY1_038 [Ralstonia phage RpY1]
MATYFYGVNVGDNEYQTAVSTTTTGKDVEVVVNTSANVPSREDLLLAVEKLENFITRLGYAPL